MTKIQQYNPKIQNKKLFIYFVRKNSNVNIQLIFNFYLINATFLVDLGVSVVVWIKYVPDSWSLAFHKNV